MNRLSKIILITLTLVLALACMTDIASACPTCKDALAGDPAQANMVKSYFWSILLMMSMPFLTLGGVASYFYYEVCRAKATRAAVAPEIALQS